MSIYREDIPSSKLEVLSRVLNKRVIKLERYSWLPPEEVVTEFQIPKSMVFRFAVGPLILGVEPGLMIGVSSLEAKASVTVWVEADETEHTRADDAVIDDPELYVIDARDPIYSDSWLGSVIGQRVTSIVLFTRDPTGAKDGDLPREVGLGFRFEGGRELILSHQLHVGSDSFAIITRAEIRNGLEEHLHETHLFDD